MREHAKNGHSLLFRVGGTGEDVVSDAEVFSVDIYWHKRSEEAENRVQGPR